MLKQPIGVKKLTNVAIIRLKKGNSRFEIACYKNKALDWRAGKEDILDDVLQIDEIFCNTEKGDLVNQKELDQHFPGQSKRDIIIQILEKGEMQVSGKERELLLRDTRNSLVNLVASRVVHPDTNRLFPAKIIEEAIYSLGFDVKINDSAKKQANFLIKELSSKYYLKKADMEIKVTIREEWINEGEKAGADLLIPKTVKQDFDEESEEEILEEEQTDTTKTKKTAEDQIQKSANKKTNKKKRKNSEEEWEKIESKSKPVGRLCSFQMDQKMPQR